MSQLVESNLIDGLSVRYLKYHGQWQVFNEYRTTGRAHFWLKVQIFLTMLLCGPFTVCQIISPFYIDFDLEKFTIITMHALCCVQSYGKQGAFLYYAKIHSWLFDVIKRDLLTSIPPHKQAQASSIYRRISWWSNLFCIFANFTNYFSTTSWAMTPGIKSEYIAFHVGNMKEVTTGPVKIMGGWYPVPFTESPWSTVVYYYEVLLLFCTCVIISLYECMLTQLVLSLYAHFEVLDYHIATLRIEDAPDGDYHSQYRAIIEDHQKLLRYGAELKSSFDFVITIILGTGAINLVISIFQFVFGNKGAFLTFKYILFLGWEIVEFVTLCVSATLLESASANIQFAIYQSDWYKGNKELRNTAQMVMVKSTRPVSLRSLKIYPVNVQTLMSVIQFTYSVSTLMSRMVEK